MKRRASRSRRPTLVSFSGIDGSGKSTQIETLRARLSGMGLRILLVTFWDDVARLKGIREVSGHRLFKGENGVGSPDRPINRRDKNVRAWYMTAVRFGLYFVDALSLRMVVREGLKADFDVVIFDRYHYDELANLGFGNGITRAYVQMLLSFVPRPDIGFLLDADPIQARARKPEYPIDFLHTSRACYLALAKRAGMKIIPPQAVHDVEREILQQVVTKLSPEGLRGGRFEQFAGANGTRGDLQNALRADLGDVRSSTV